MSVKITGDTIKHGGSDTINITITSTGPQSAHSVTDANHLTNKSYVDNKITGLTAKDAVRVATTANGTLASSFAAGQTIDGIELVAGNRILIKNQTAAAENGIYTVNSSGAPTRATDFDAVADVTNGVFTFVQEGSSQADTGWMMTTDGSITFDTTALTFSQFSANTLANGAVTTAKLAADAVTGAKIADDAIDSDHIADGAIDTAHLAADAVDGTKIADDAIDSEHIADGAIDTAHIAASQITLACMAANSVDSDQYVDGSIDTAHLAADAVDGTKIADNAIDSEHYVDGSIDAAHIADGAVTTAKLANGAVTTAKIAADAVTTAKLADDAIETAKIKDGEITVDKIAANSVSTVKIQNNAVTSAKIATLTDLSIDVDSSGSNAFGLSITNSATQDDDAHLLKIVGQPTKKALTIEHGTIDIATSSGNSIAEGEGLLVVSTNDGGQDINSAAIYVDGVADRAAIAATNGSMLAAVSAGSPKNITIKHDGTDGVINVSHGAISCSTHDVKIGAGKLKIGGNAVTSTADELNILDGVTSTTAELNILDGVTSTAAELNLLDGVTATTAELNILDGVTANASELNILDGVTSSTAELNILDGVTATATELNILDGVTATATELNLLDGVTSTTAELNILDGVTATATELILLDGVTASTAELNILDGVTATATELNLLDGVTSSTAELNLLDGVTATTAELNILDGVTATATELNILDGVTATTAELNILDGNTAATSTTLADADRLVVNDDGTMKHVALTDLETYLESALDSLTNVAAVGDLTAGSIASGFGNINIGSNTFTGGSFVTTSDISLKTNINEIENSLEKVNKIRGVNFTWKEDNREDFGVIAQEVEEVAPHAVHEGSDGHKKVDYSKLTTLLIQAVKEQQKLLEEQRKDIDLLKEKVNSV
jgi:hypothetical protein